MLGDLVHWGGQAVTWAAEHLGAPILTGVVAGLAVPFALRWQSTSAEVQLHNREALELNREFRRFVSDLDRQVARQRTEHLRQWIDYLVRAEVTEIMRGNEEKLSQDELLAVEHPDLPTPQERIGHRDRWVAQLEASNFDALWQFRDEALRKREQYIQIVESEARRHHRYRRRKGSGHPALRLSEWDLRSLGAWREQRNPFGGKPSIIKPEDVTTNEHELRVLETNEGLTWEEAQRSIARSWRSARHIY